MKVIGEPETLWRGVAQPSFPVGNMMLGFTAALLRGTSVGAIAEKGGMADRTSDGISSQNRAEIRAC